MPFVDANGISIYYEIVGEGPKVLYIGGSYADLRQQPNIVHSPLARSCELLAYDQRGLARSSKPDVPYTMADYADDAAALMECLGWNCAAIIGVSFGGMVAQEFAIRHIERTERLVLCCTSAGGVAGSSYDIDTLFELSLDEHVETFLTMGDRRWGDPRNRSPEFVAMKQWMKRAWSIGANDDEVAIGRRRQIEARKGHDTSERLHLIKVPTLICGGRYDTLAPPENIEALAKRIPNATLEFFEGGHLFLGQDPRAYPRIVEFVHQ